MNRRFVFVDLLGELVLPFSVFLYLSRSLARLCTSCSLNRKNQIGSVNAMEMFGGLGVINETWLHVIGTNKLFLQIPQTWEYICLTLWKKSRLTQEQNPLNQAFFSKLPKISFEYKCILSKGRFKWNYLTLKSDLTDLERNCSAYDIC